ncbi:MAG: hypothetical protein II820_03930 [Ruminiclostridium sp.]|nr:hypothetical protein [Ruminiclostridium sp.]
MADLSAKLAKLEQHIIAAAAADAGNILADAEKRAAAMINEEKERGETEQGSVLGAKISKYRSDERKRVSERRYAADRKVLMHRNSLVDGLFNDIRNDIEALTASEEYAGYLASCAEAADNREKIDSTVSIFCRKADLAEAEKIAKKYGAKAAADRNIVLGGLIFKYPEKGIYIDLTLDTSFENERGAFASRSEMQL